MKYIHVLEIPIDLLPAGCELEYGYMFPVLEGDLSLISKLGDPILIEELIPQLQPGDELAGSRLFVEWLEEVFSSMNWLRKPAYWAQESILEVLPPEECE